MFLSWICSHWTSAGRFHTGSLYSWSPPPIMMCSGFSSWQCSTSCEAGRTKLVEFKPVEASWASGASRFLSSFGQTMTSWAQGHTCLSTEQHKRSPGCHPLIPRSHGSIQASGGTPTHPPQRLDAAHLRLELGVVKAVAAVEAPAPLLRYSRNKEAIPAADSSARPREPWAIKSKLHQPRYQFGAECL